MTDAEREQLFARIANYLHMMRLAYPPAPAPPPPRTDEPPGNRGYDCPGCDLPDLARRYRDNPGGLDYCPACDWEEFPF